MNRLGLEFKDLNPVKTDENVHETVREVLVIYDRCLQDTVLSRAAYGLAVGGLSLALNVSLRTASLLVEHALTLRGMKPP
jgi:hypothetical protein